MDEILPIEVARSNLRISSFAAMQQSIDRTTAQPKKTAGRDVCHGQIGRILLA
jgi:hypothetical protein